MAETSNYTMFEGTDTTGKDVNVYSTTGQGQSEQAFIDALKQYNLSGKTPAGFTVLPKGAFQDVARQGFEAVNQPVQSAVGQLNDPNARINSLPPALAGPLKFLLRQPAEQVNTPEKAATVAGMIGTGVATGGLSYPLQAASLGVGAAASNMLGRATFGTPQDTGKSLAEGAAAGLAQGVQGILKYAVGSGMSQLAQSGVARKLMDFLKKEHGGFVTSPDIINTVASTKAGLQKIVDIGMDGVRQDVQQISTGLVPTLTGSLTTSGSPAAGYVRQAVTGSTADALVYGANAGMTRSLSQTATAELRSQGKQYFQLTQDLLNNVGDNKAYTATKDKINTLVMDMADTIKKEFKGQSQAVIDKNLAVLDGVVSQQKDAINRYVNTAHLFDVLRKSTNDTGGFDVQQFQRNIANYYRNNPGELMDVARHIAGRGTDLTQGIDRAIIPSVKLPPWLLGIRTPQMGQKYVGSVGGAGGTAVNIMGNVAGKDAIESFMGKGR